MTVALPRSPVATGTSVLLSPMDPGKKNPKLAGGWQGGSWGGGGGGGARSGAQGLALQAIHRIHHRINRQAALGRNQSSQYSPHWCQSLCSSRDCHLVKVPRSGGGCVTWGPHSSPPGQGGCWEPPEGMGAAEGCPKHARGCPTEPPTRPQAL